MNYLWFNLLTSSFRTWIWKHEPIYYLKIAWWHITCAPYSMFTIIIIIKFYRAKKTGRACFSLIPLAFLLSTLFSFFLPSRQNAAISPSYFIIYFRRDLESAYSKCLQSNIQNHQNTCQRLSSHCQVMSRRWYGNRLSFMRTFTSTILFIVFDRSHTFKNSILTNLWICTFGIFSN